MSYTFKKASLHTAIHAALMLTLASVTHAETTGNINNDLPSTTLSAVNVVGDAENAEGPVEGVAATKVISTTGISQSILKSTQSVSVIGQEEIAIIGAKDLNQAVDYTAGVNRTEVADRTTDSYIIRGFMNPITYRDGQKYQANVYNGQQEMYGLDRIEVVKGPASVMSGTLPPGGVINAISKKPFFDNAYEVNAEVGNFSHKQVSTDLNHVVNDDLAVRLVGLYQDSDTYTDLVNDDRLYIAPSLTWLPSDDTTITLKADFQHDETMYVYGLPVEGTLESTANGKIDQDTFFGIKGFDEYDNERYTLGYDISHFINPDFELRHKLQYMETDINFPYATLEGLVAGSQTEYQRRAQKRQDDSDQLTSSLTGIYYWNANDNIDNVTLFGIDYAKQNHETERYSGTASNIDLFNPDHSQDSVGDVFSPNMAASGSQGGKQKGVFLQNQMTVNGKWVGVLGVRYDDTEQDLSATFIPNYDQEGDYDATTGRAGLVYLMDNGIAPYASINQSFETVLGTDKDGDLFEPTEGIQYEVGVRYQPQGSDTLLTGSLFRIDQENLLVADPDNVGFSKQLGEVRSQGVELEAKTQIGDNANLIAAYAYTDARTVESSPATPELEGKRSDNVPYNKFSLWGDYTFTDYNLPQLRIGAGVRYVGSTVAGSSSIDVPSYTLVDALVSYKVDDNWLLSLNANNLLDEDYVTCTYACFYGEPRNVVGKVTYQW